MRSVRVTKPDGSKEILDEGKILEHYANEVCCQCGWDLKSPAWRDLARPKGSHPNFLAKRAILMIPGGVAEILP